MITTGKVDELCLPNLELVAQARPPGGQAVLDHGALQWVRYLRQGLSAWCAGGRA